MSFFHSAVAFFKKVFTNSAGWTHAAQVAITVASPLVETLAQVAGGANVGAEVTAIMNTIKTDFGVVSVTLTQIQQQPGNVNAVALLKNTLAAIKDNLAGLLKVAAVKDPNMQQTVTTTANLLIGEIDAVLSSIPAAS